MHMRHIWQTRRASARARAVGWAHGARLPHTKSTPSGRTGATLRVARAGGKELEPVPWALTSASRPGEPTLVTVAGELDLQVSAQFDAFLADISGDIDLDFASLTFLDSSGIRVLLQHCQRKTANVRVVAVSDIAYRVFDIMGVLDTLGIPASRRSR